MTTLHVQTPGLHVIVDHLISKPWSLMWFYDGLQFLGKHPVRFWSLAATNSATDGEWRRPACSLLSTSSEVLNVVEVTALWVKLFNGKPFWISSWTLLTVQARAQPKMLPQSWKLTFVQNISACGIIKVSGAKVLNPKTMTKGPSTQKHFCPYSIL